MRLTGFSCCFVVLRATSCQSRRNEILHHTYKNVFQCAIVGRENAMVLLSYGIFHIEHPISPKILTFFCCMPAKVFRTSEKIVESAPHLMQGKYTENDTFLWIWHATYDYIENRRDGNGSKGKSYPFHSFLRWVINITWMHIQKWLGFIELILDWCEIWSCFPYHPPNSSKGLFRFTDHAKLQE